jgi:hypothetical protein
MKAIEKLTDGPCRRRRLLPDGLHVGARGQQRVMERMQAADITRDVHLVGGPSTMQAFRAIRPIAEVGLLLVPLIHGAGCARPSRGRPDVSHAHGRADLPSLRRWFALGSPLTLFPRPPPSCRRRARTRTGAPRAPRRRRARGSSRRRTPGPPRPGTCTPCVDSSRLPPTPVGFAADRASSLVHVVCLRALCQPGEIS